jgi:exodeoxyribonuclease-5
MDFSNDQLVALDKCKTWLGGRSPSVFTLYGCAGTGKTTLAKFLAADVSGSIYFVAFTGKAAEVLQRSGCPNARTVHSLIYSPKSACQKRLTGLEAQLSQLPEDALESVRDKLLGEIAAERKNASRPMFSLKADSEIKFASLVVVDECSMVSNQMGSDLLSFGVPILALGDPGQLPPVGAKGFFDESRPDHLLTSIHRQAGGSPIIELATKARLGETLEYGDYGQNCRVIEKATPEMAIEADQIICGRNKTRAAINKRTRSLLDLDPDGPVIGDKLICGRNNSENGLLNGSQWILESFQKVMDDVGMVTVAPHMDSGPSVSTTCHMHFFEGREKELAPYMQGECDKFEYGYAVTCHKAQGSQWDDVLIFDESHAFGPDRHKWLYTSITRAAKSVTIVRSR